MKSFIASVFLFLVLGKLITFSIALADEFTSKMSTCELIRGAVDMGSGTTKIKVARVNKCQRSIAKILFEKNIKISYQADLDRHKSTQFSKEILIAGERAIKDVMLEIARTLLPHDQIEWKGVATAAFRSAKNASSFILALNKKYPINIRILNQVEEAILGYHSAFVYEEAPVNAVVWDIGAGSGQWTTQIKGEYHFYLSELASETFKDRIIKEIKKNDQLKTPNPFNKEQRKQAEEIIYQEVLKINPKIKEALHHKVKVIGIGSVHFFSVLGQIHGTKNPKKMNTYTIDQVETSIQGRLGQTDQQIGGEYAATDVSNLIYVAAFMKALDIKNIVVRKINLNDGLLLNY